MSQLIDGKKIADKIKDRITQEVFKIGKRPNLAIILIKGRSDSELYVNLKEREAKKVGIDTHLYKMPSGTKEEELIDTINFLNNDKMIDGILVQLPLPKHIDTDKIINTILPEKDVDGFHSENLALLKKGEATHMPPVYGAVLEMLGDINCDLENKKVCILSNSKIFGDNLANLLNTEGAQCESIKVDNKKLVETSSSSDILISAIGKPHFIKKNLIKKDAIIIDIGITKEGKAVKGDVDFEDVEDHCAYITPVPGGVGPLTIAMTFQNTLNSFKRKI
ncbi:MAG: bifunctional 5,10-methylenetetrahydrofolate dehydrogenase/5,10-methenyltetrahydrofolate cyclohydrolase [Patescibacteria group bacterium]|jgi:methylenetetrahydrofolate dehydrogenase (NADP+)/methenyltetrahydrofolate cyclohydrolase|nr:bifunctional 5,10-methylenetetrahydrofolate dehydrogenase/5,10-methenyltetrahydrofolate cyclohydrolase [Patescibacteria group bacterium]